MRLDSVENQKSISEKPNVDTGFHAELLRDLITPDSSGARGRVPQKQDQSEDTLVFNNIFEEVQSNQGNPATAGADDIGQRSRQHFEVPRAPRPGETLSDNKNDCKNETDEEARRKNFPAQEQTELDRDKDESKTGGRTKSTTGSDTIHNREQRPSGRREIIEDLMETLERLEQL